MTTFLLLMPRVLLLAISVWTLLVLSTASAALDLQTEANVMVEASFTASRNHEDPANDVTLDVVFAEPNGRGLRVPAFWAGKYVWKVRYASAVLGAHRFRTECSDATDAGLHGITGTVEVKPYTGGNPNFSHGPLRLATNRRYLEHADGTPFFWLGDTWWMGLCHRMSWPEDIQRLATDRKAKGFNVIQIVAGLYPDMPPFDPRGANEAGFPWEKDFARIRPEYFDAADQRLRYLVEQGFTPCIVGAWGYFAPIMGVDRAKQHWRNLVARYGAWPVVWCVAGEANLPYYQVKGFPYDDRGQVKSWTEVTRYLRGIDPFHRLVTIHPTGIGRLSARNAIDDISLIDFDLLQTPHGQREAVSPTVRTVRECYADKPVMPVINGEAAYEMLGDNLPTEWTRRMFWLCMMNGAAGHTYGANGIWQVNRRGQPHGPSPTAGSPPTGYGVIPWDEAMNLPGSRQVGFGKKLLAQYRWQDFQPHPEWAAFAGNASLSFEASQWIWFPEGKPAQDAPVEKRFFRKSFVLPEGKTVSSARLRVSADDQFSAKLNGEILGTAADWHLGKQFDEIARLLIPGTNVIAIVAENVASNVPANPAGLIVCLEIQFGSGETLKVVSDATWSCAKTDVAGWEKAGFDDTTWLKALPLAKHGEAPWGRIDPANDEAFGPQSAGIPDIVRVIYVPENKSIVVKSPGAAHDFSPAYFDPVSGAKTPGPPIPADASGSWTCPPPAGIDHDWVLILEAKAR